MADQRNGGISWTEQTWNPIRGCSLVSEGCRNCYAMRVAARFNKPGQAYEGLAVMGNNGARWTGKVQLVEEHLSDPIRWKRPRMIFVNSMSDLFHEDVPDSWIDRIFSVMAAAPHHTFQVLTKRVDRMKEYFSDLAYRTEMIGIEGEYITGYCRYLDEGKPRWPLPLPNVWLGVSVEDQKTAEDRIPTLIRTPAAVRWISAEPLLGQIDLFEALGDYGVKRAARLMVNKDDPNRGVLNWVVVGGESGPGARPMHPKWARRLRDQCAELGVPYHFKQWGEWGLSSGDKRDGIWTATGFVESMTFELWQQGLERDGIFMRRVGKHKAGRMLDARIWDEYPHQTEAA